MNLKEIYPNQSRVVHYGKKKKAFRIVSVQLNKTGGYTKNARI